MHITLTGNLGSGKSTIAGIMSEKYGFEIYSTGKIQRELAKERGLTVLEMNKLMQQDHSFDNIIDERTTRLSIESQKDLFFDSRLAWHFAKNAFKVFLSVSIDEASRRVFNDNKRGNVESYKSIEETKANLIERAHTEDIRYNELYGINYFDLNNYNLVLDSTFTKPEILADVILNEKKAYEEAVARGLEEIPSRILLSPSRLLGIAGNTRDNDSVFDSDGVVTLKDGDLEIVSGRAGIEQAARNGYEFVSVKYTH